MEQITEPARRIDVVHETDVLVVGSGPGGLAAAIGAARAGVSVTLVERFGCFGGNMTVVGVEGFAWYRHEKTVDSEGVGREFEDRARSADAGAPEPQSDSFAPDAEAFKLIADDFVREEGITPMLHRAFAAPVMLGTTIRGIVTESKAGRQAIIAQRVIDATGDADVAQRAGAAVFKTPREEMMAASVMFSMTGVDRESFLNEVRENPQTYRDWEGVGWKIETTGKEDDMFSPFLRRPFHRAREAGLIAEDIGPISGTWGAIHDSGDLTYLNLVHLAGCDGTDPGDLTRCEMAGRRHALAAVDALQSYQPGCADARLRNFGMTLGIRDTRKLDAVYNMTADDVRGEARFEDSVGVFPEFIDGYGILILPTTGRYFHVPYRCLVPKGVTNLLVAGRIVGGDKVSHAATRSMMCCTVTGQGAGVAAAVSIKHKLDTREMDISLLQTELSRQGVRLA